MPVADLLFFGGIVYTMDPALPRASVLAVTGDRVAAVASYGDLGEWRGPRTRLVDLRGRAVVPGFVDAHVHFAAYALARQEIDLESARTLEDGLARIETAASSSGERREDGWLRGRGWDRNRWGRLPRADELDRVAGGRPAVLFSHDHHSVWLSSVALQRAGITRDTPTPDGGAIERDARGDPTGVLFENAVDLVRRVLPQPTDDVIQSAIRAALPIAAAAGLTGIHNLEDAHALDAFRGIERSGDLALRVLHGVARNQLRDAAEIGLRSGIGSDWVTVGPVKLFADGALGSRTAHLLAPYAGRENNGYRGIATLDPELLRLDMRQAVEAGLDVAVHAIGDAAVRDVLDAVSEVRTSHPAAAHRTFRIEHAQLIDPLDLPRFRALNVVASMQPNHAVSDWRAADQHWGDRAAHAYAWRSVLASGACLAIGTDAPVERIEPLPNLHAAVTRQDAQGDPPGGWYPAQRLSLEEAIRAYTVGSAYAGRSTESHGLLSQGAFADLVVLDPDPFLLNAAALLDTRVSMTVVGGRVVYEANE